MSRGNNRLRRAVLAMSLIFTVLLAGFLGGVGSTSAYAATAGKQASDSQKAPAAPQIYLYGEAHAKKLIMDKELELWQDYYNNGMRHLFIESPYYTAEFLNMWMKADDDKILGEIFEELKGTAAYNGYFKPFYQKIKRDCPETVFHGTDVGHQYGSTGERYLSELKRLGKTDSEEYRRAKEVMEQGKYFYENAADVYRENKMVENFIYEFSKLSGESVMGIYGGAHVGLDMLDFTGTVPCMANQLKKKYGSAVHSVDLTYIKEDIAPKRTDTITVNGKSYKATFYGKEDLTGFKDFASREFWRLENAYNDFKNKPKNEDVLPYLEYPMMIKTGEVFAIRFTLTDGTSDFMYYRSDGNMWNGMATTEGFKLK